MAPPRQRPSGFGTSPGGNWEIGMARMPFFVPGDDGQTIRPLVALVMDGSGAIRATAMGHPEHPSEALAEALQEAIHHPHSGLQPGNPLQVTVPSARLLEELRPLLPGVAIEVGPTPRLYDAMAALREDFQVQRQLGDDQAMHTYLTADVTPEAMAGFFEAAAALYERRPWQVIPSDAPLFQVSSTALGIRGWTGCVIGQNRESFAVIMFDSIAAYEHYVHLAKIAEREGTRPVADFPRQRAINYEAKAAMPARLLKEIARYHWPVAKGDGYPTVMLIEPDLVLAPPTLVDLGRLEGVARALVQLIDDIPDLSRRWQGPEVLRKRYRVAVQGEVLSMTIGMACDAPVARSQERQERVPAALQTKVDALMQSIDGFCERHLNAEYRQLLLAAVCALARKRPSPLLAGREPSWCAGIVHAIGMANFLFDKTQTPHCKAPEIYAAFGVSAQTGQAHSKKVRDLLKIGAFDPKWTLPSKLDDSPLAWMLEVDGFIVDIRTMPLDIQIQACAQGLIPYVPAMRRPEQQDLAKDPVDQPA